MRRVSSIERRLTRSWLRYDIGDKTGSRRVETGPRTRNQAVPCHELIISSSQMLSPESLHRGLRLVMLKESIQNPAIG